MKRLVIVSIALAGCVLIVGAQAPPDGKTLAFLKQIFPAATSFGPKEGDPPHFTAFVADPKTPKPVPVGVAWWTTELEPLERGYDGPIKMLVGMDMKGVLAGLVVAEEHEPFGRISVMSPRFAPQFKGKSVRDKFVLGEDVDAVSSATITMSSAVRTIKKSSRRIATQVLPPPDHASP